MVVKEKRETNSPTGAAAADVIMCKEHNRTTSGPHLHDVIASILTWIVFAVKHTLL